jgi:hypothetical protein
MRPRLRLSPDDPSLLLLPLSSNSRACRHAVAAMMMMMMMRELSGSYNKQKAAARLDNKSKIKRQNQSRMGSANKKCLCFAPDFSAYPDN